MHKDIEYRSRKRPKIIEVVYQQLTQLGRTDSAVGAPKFTKVQIFPAALHARPGGLVYIFDVYGFAHPLKT